MQMMQKRAPAAAVAFAEYAAAFVIGGVMYGALETIFRGYTHPSMIVTGGICFDALYMLDKYSRLSVFVRAVIGAVIITAAEFAAGCICNLWLGWDIWDYSHLHPNLWGQICLPFTVLWAFLSVPAFGVAALLRGAVGVRSKRASDQPSAFSAPPASDGTSVPDSDGSDGDGVSP